MVARNMKQCWVRRCRMGKGAVLKASLEGMVENVCRPLKPFASKLLLLMLSCGEAYDLWLEGVGSAMEGMCLCFPQLCSLLTPLPPPTLVN